MGRGSTGGRAMLLSMPYPERLVLSARADGRYSLRMGWLARGGGGKA